MGSCLFCCGTLGTSLSFSGFSFPYVRNEWRATNGIQALVLPFERRLLGQALSQPWGARGDGTERQAQPALLQRCQPMSSEYGWAAATLTGPLLWDIEEVVPLHSFPMLGPREGIRPSVIRISNEHVVRSNRMQLLK